MTLRVIISCDDLFQEPAYGIIEGEVKPSVKFLV
jgi:hypothetical protein